MNFGMREFTPSQAEDLYAAHPGARTRTGSIITHLRNRSPGDWYALFPNAVLAESALDRAGQQRPPRHLPGPHVPASAPA